MAPLIKLNNHNPETIYRECVVVHPMDKNNSLTIETPCNAFDRISSLEIQHIMEFLPVHDRFAFIRTQKDLFLNQTLVETPVYTSFCGHCFHCEEKNEHLCQDKDNTQLPSFWHALVRHMGRETSLRELHLANCPTFTADTLRVCTPQPFEKLRVLNLHGCRGLEGEGVRQLSILCKNLQELHLRDMVIDELVLKQFITHNHRTLRVIDLQGCHTLTGNEIQSFIKCRHLEALSLWGCHNVDNGSIAAVVRACPYIVRLNLRYCHRVDDALVYVIAESLPKLQYLNLHYCHRVSDQAINVVANQLGRLQYLDLSQCVKITDAAIMKVTSSLKLLKELRLWGCIKLTVASVGAISERLPSLELVDVRGAVVTTACEPLGNQGRDTIGMFNQPLAYAVAA